MSEYVGEGQFTRVYRGALAQPTDARVELALKQVKTRLAHKERDYIIGEVRTIHMLLLSVNRFFLLKTHNPNLEHSQSLR